MFDKNDYIRFAIHITILVSGMILYQLFISPTVRDMMDDWNFLHAARQQAIIQSQQQKAEQK